MLNTPFCRSFLAVHLDETIASSSLVGARSASYALVALFCYREMKNNVPTLFSGPYRCRGDGDELVLAIGRDSVDALHSVSPILRLYETDPRTINMLTTCARDDCIDLFVVW